MVEVTQMGRTPEIKYHQDPRVKDQNQLRAIHSLALDLEEVREQEGVGFICHSVLVPFPSDSLQQILTLVRTDQEHQPLDPTKPLKRHSYIKSFYGSVHLLKPKTPFLTFQHCR